MEPLIALFSKLWEIFCLNISTGRHIFQYIILNIKIKEPKNQIFEKFSVFGRPKFFCESFSIFFRFRTNGTIFKIFKKIFENFSKNFSNFFSKNYSWVHSTYDNISKFGIIDVFEKCPPNNSNNIPERTHVESPTTMKSSGIKKIF